MAIQLSTAERTDAIEAEYRQGATTAINDLRAALMRAQTYTVSNVIIEAQQAYITKLRRMIATLEEIQRAPL